MAYTSIDDPTLYFNTKLYTGTGTSQSVTGVGFSPSMSWFKQRNTVRGHILEDIVRGAGNTLFPHDTSSETAGGFYLTSFDSDGFTLPSSNVGTNESGGTYASWNWLASNTTASNTDGSITSSVSANTTSGFSIVSYTGTGATATVGHGLGVAPKFMIIKNRTDATNWNVYTTVIDGSMDYLYLNLTDAKGDSSASVPTSSVLNLTTSNDVNGSGDDMIAYCFAEKKGFSKFGSYTGNGNADGTFVYTGFKPAWVMWKKSSSTGSWWIGDSTRDVDNVVQQELYADTNNAENTESGGRVDFLSNGFKHRNSGGTGNTSGATYIYMAFAENPFTTSTGIPTTAR